MSIFGLFIIVAFIVALVASMRGEAYSPLDHLDPKFWPYLHH